MLNKLLRLHWESVFKYDLLAQSAQQFPSVVELAPPAGASALNDANGPCLFFAYLFGANASTAAEGGDEFDFMVADVRFNLRRFTERADRLNVRQFGDGFGNRLHAIFCQVEKKLLK